MRTLGVVLAGGQSSRMRQDKALLTLNGSTMLERSVNALRPLLPEVWISRQTDQAVPMADARIVPDTMRDCGPLGGVAAVMEQAVRAGFDAVLLLPVDLPACSAADLSPLMAAGEREQKPVCFSGHFLPLYLPVNSAVLEFTQRQLTDSKARKSVASVFYQFDGIQLPPPDSNALTNTNTREEWLTATREEQHG
ncbi:molybdenum cofactor guanylyltransferase [Thalassolituus sp. LLYu03]|uniref:molybdenum cofactor guanylyltransferase n=1 Tax=Thalassolituus sp. LLYu03 TaxID=3421656 RepID=UPI003D2AF75A